MGESVKKMDHRGMSLVEIIIVIALVSVIAGVVGYGLSLISNKPVEECAKKVEMVLNSNRTSSMGKKEAWVEFYVKDNMLTVREYLLSSRAGAAPYDKETPIGAKGVNMRITYDSGSYLLMSDSGVFKYNSGSLIPLPTLRVRVAFERDSGAVKEVTVDGENRKCKTIEIFKGDDPDVGTGMTIELETLTGKVTVK